MYAAQRRARAAALKEIAEQIRVSISASSKLRQGNTSSGGDGHRPWKRYEEHIHTEAAIALSEWDEVDTWYSPDNYFWSMVVLDRARYFERTNRHTIRAVRAVTGALRASSAGPLFVRLRELHQAMLVLDDFGDSALEADFGGRRMDLRAEVPRAMDRILLAVELRPTTDGLILSPTELAPDSLGVRVVFDGTNDVSVPVRWSVSDQGTAVTASGYGADGVARVRVLALPASVRPIRLTASLDLEELGYDLLRRGFRLPSCTIALRRRPPRVHLAGLDSFSRELVDRLLERSRITLTVSREEADLRLHATLAGEEETHGADGLYRAQAELTLRLVSANGEQVLAVRELIRGPGAPSRPRAHDGLRRLAVETATRRIERAF